MTTKEQVLGYAKQEDVFTIDEIAQDLYCDKYRDKHRLYHTLSQLCKDNKLHRYQRGIYGYVYYSHLFQKSGFCPEEEALAQLYLRNNEGYISGADFFYMICLSTWLPAKKTIVTNKVKKEKVGKTIVFCPPRTHITQNNKNYLQLLDCLERLNNYAIDAPNPYGLLKRYIQNEQFDIPTLIYIAQTYYNDTALKELNKCLDADNF